MTLDDDAVPRDDAVAGATRRALDGLAGEPAPTWAAVTAGARRVRVLRVVGAAAVALVVVGAGAAVAATTGASKGSVTVEGGGGQSVRSTTSSTSTSTTTTPDGVTSTLPAEAPC